MSNKYLDLYVENLKNILNKEAAFYKSRISDRFKKVITDKYFWKRVLRGSSGLIICKRNTLINENLVDKKVSIYTGNRLESFITRSPHVGHKFGEFCFTKFFHNRAQVHKRTNTSRNALSEIYYLKSERRKALKKKKLVNKMRKELEKELETLRKEKPDAIIDIAQKVKEKFVFKDKKKY